MTATAQYLTGQMRPGHAALLAGFQQYGNAAVAALHPALDIPYGPHPRQTFDLFQSPASCRATLLYLHAGFWQARDKGQFRFLAPAFLAHGIDVALVNYPLCPQTTLPSLVAAVRDAVPAILRHAASLGRGGRLIVAGHSAGAHLAVELALTDWATRGLAAPIAGAVALSGVYDLEPLLDTALNDNLRLDHATARALSPVHRARAGLPPALFGVGGEETEAFQAQNAAMYGTWMKAGNQAELRVVAGADHFTLLVDLADIIAWMMKVLP